MWQQLSPVSPSAFVGARLRLHRASQIQAAVGHAFVKRRDDPSYASLPWLAPAARFQTEPFAGGFRLELEAGSLTLFPARPEARSFDLTGKTLNDGLQWARVQLLAFGSAAADIPVRPLDHAMADHPVARGMSFSDAHPNASKATADWPGTASVLLGEIRKSHEHGSPVRCWPDHFDMATLILIEHHKGSEARSVAACLRCRISTLRRGSTLILPRCLFLPPGCTGIARNGLVSSSRPKPSGTCRRRTVSHNWPPQRFDRAVEAASRWFPKESLTT